MSALAVTFQDSGREPQCAPDPLYPNGVVVNLSKGRKSCTTALPYPAPRCGFMLVLCPTCGRRVAVSVAGRADDPISVTVACRRN